MQKIKQVRQSINKAWLKVKPNRSGIDGFKANLIQLIDRINENESEEHHKKLVSDFLEETYYRGHHYINTKGRNDQVIHNGKEPESSVGVIIEAKKPTNKSEMLSKENINTKAFQELVLYFLRERITQKNLELKHLIATNIYEWFVFDAAVFEKAFAKNKKLVKQFEDFEAGRLSGTTTDFFYNNIAQPFVEEVKEALEFTWLDIRTYHNPLRNNNKKDDAKLIALYKLFSPEHLLKLPFANDSNSLDSRFYKELLHLIGLEETKEGSKKVIQRPKEGDRNSGSLLENTIDHLETRDKLSRLTNSAQYGTNKEERLFNVGLELCITWMNRILFMKLLEAQLLSYHNGNNAFAFLNLKLIKDYDELDTLFFEVLAVQSSDRKAERLERFRHVPYLNSSLFEPTELEHDTLFISNLADNRTLSIISGTVLKGDLGKKRSGALNAIEYLFSFLDAYDFSSEGGEVIQEDNKTLINASVLGLIFEKINGYKDGSFFTPGFITMYMCRETIRRAVVQKFNEVKGWGSSNFSELTEDLADFIRDNDRKEARKEANAIINSIKVCDPAVGSGHFLVSALNELLSVKADLKILTDRDGERLSSYEVTVENDELIVTDLDNILFEYHPDSKESQRVQETLFHEKQTIIENCLFGVDINPNSVKICRLRLWIELLKHAYYKTSGTNKVIPQRMPGSEAPSQLKSPDQVRGDSVNRDGEIRHLETLPNIDINIKTGNSLISRFALDADLKEALKTSKWSITGYRVAVDTYRNARNKDEKREMERLMDDIKSSFRTEIASNDPKVLRLKKKSAELVKLTTQTSMFDQTAKEKKAWTKKTETLTKEITKLESEIEEIKSNKIYENAFEWRFEFPEVLNDDGDFVGFDVVIGNPPYIRQEEFKEIKPYLQTHYSTYAGTADMYVYFVERAFQNLKQDGQFTYIIPNKWMRAGYGKNLRVFLKEQKLTTILDFGDLPVFEEATTYPCILGAEKTNPSERFDALNIETLDFPEGLERYVEKHKMEVLAGELPENGWALSSIEEQQLLLKITSKSAPLGEFVNGNAYRGVLTGLTKAFLVSKNVKERLVLDSNKDEEVIVPFLQGRDLQKYVPASVNSYLLLLKKGGTIDNLVAPTEEVAWTWFKQEYPNISNWLSDFEEKAKIRTDKGDFWWELRACDYYDKFAKPKIMYQVMQVKPCFVFDERGAFCNNSIWFIPTEDKVLLAILNSKMGWWLISKYCTAIQNGYQLIWKYFSQVPIAKADGVQRKAVTSKVTEILSLKKENPQANTGALEAEIDAMVYALYGLTEEEIVIVEESVG